MKLKLRTQNTQKIIKRSALYRSLWDIAMMCSKENVPPKLLISIKNKESSFQVKNAKANEWDKPLTNQNKEKK